jgi:hypothetical protein
LRDVRYPPDRFTSAPDCRWPIHPCRFRLSSRDFLAHLIGRLVLAEADVNGVTQEAIGGPSQIGDLGDKLWLDPMRGDPRAAGRLLRGWFLKRANESARAARLASALRN